MEFVLIASFSVLLVIVCEISNVDLNGIQEVPFSMHYTKNQYYAFKRELVMLTEGGCCLLKTVSVQGIKGVRGFVGKKGRMGDKVGSRLVCACGGA